MADFSKIDLYGTVYSVKDEVARAKAEESLKNDVTISYESESSTIKIVKTNPVKQ